MASLTFSQDLRSGGVLKPEQAIMDIRHYAIVLEADPAAKTINGHTTISLELSQPGSILLLDLWHGLQVKSVSVNGTKQPFTHVAGDLLRITTASPLPARRHTVRVDYGGRPAEAPRPPWIGGFQWTKDSKGKDWIAISCQGEGAKIYFPCKDHPSDEPNEGVDMIITVPRGLVVTGPGLLQGVRHSREKSTYHWKTKYTISNYCVVFNAGNYRLVKREYTTVEGRKVPMEYYVLEENVEKAQKILDLFEQSARILEKYFGEYPWAEEAMRLTETPYLGMEHQTNITYGNKYRFQKKGSSDFDWLLHHEFGHEWWANKVTNRDWAHMWIQEGICSFGDALATRELAGEEAYQKDMSSRAIHAQNRFPLVRGEQVDSDSAYHGDIYGKGAFFMHTLRHLMGDEIFFPTLRKLATDPQYTYHNTVTTADVEKLFSSAAGRDLGPLFRLYVYSTDKLEIVVKQTDHNRYEVSLKNMDIPLPVEIGTAEGVRRVELSRRPLSVESATQPVVDPRYFYLKRVTYE
ncbi:MAG TPA: M1 family metallopeptidase [Chitinophagaceae bacterium]|nr:M1 family metallopeptidase [Chitinophagaceae bacterium]